MSDKLKFELSVDETNVVLTGLCELPAKHSLSLLQKIQSQAQEQMQLKTQESTELGDQQLLTEGE